MTPWQWEPATFIGLGVALAVVGFLVYRLAKWHADSDVAWLPLGSALLPGVTYNANSPLGATRLRACVDCAVESLATRGPWGRERVIAGLSYVRVYVKDTPDWRTLFGVKVQGQTVGQVVYVGSDALALCHELIHRCGMVLDGITDTSHTHWDELGFRRAEAAYEAWARQ